jgi:hypothetical protein
VGANRRVKRELYYKKRLTHHWRETFYYQIAAYFLVLVLWWLPIPNPVKMLAQTVHELSHAMAALLTGGHIFGTAVSPGGGGVTLGTGGNMFIVLLAGHIGSSLCGALLYYLSVKRKPDECLLALTAIVVCSASLGWLNDTTIFLGTGSVLIMLALVRARNAAKVFFVRMVGSACCLYAPMDVLGEVSAAGGGLSVGGAKTPSDIHQLGELLGINPIVIGVVIVTLQAVLLAFLLRRTCSVGAKQAVKQEVAERRRRRIIWRDVHPRRHRYVIR